MYGENGPPPRKQRKSGKLATLFADDSEDEPDTTSVPTAPTAGSQKPWLMEFNQYLNGNDEVPEGMTLIHWWGVSICIAITFFHELIICVILIAQLITLACLGIPRSGLPRYYGLFSVQRASVLIGWNYDQQTP